jgi:uncharacterized membrane protein YfcA
MLIESLSFGPWQWLVAALGALMVGVSKTGVAGLGILFVAAFAVVFPSTKAATGIVLPLLILGDLVAVFWYRRHMQWKHLGRLFPWTAAGVVIGFFALGRLSDHTARLWIGAIILSMTALSYWLRWRRAAGATLENTVLEHWGVAAVIGVLAGFTTLLANAAGPLMAIYLVAMRLPKLEYVGTAAVFFCLLNLFKVPFMVDLGLVTSASLTVNLLLAPLVLIGALAGRSLLTRINQRWFEELALGLSVIAGLVLLR